MPETFSDHPPMAARPSAPRQRLRYARILDTAAGFARTGLDAVGARVLLLTVTGLVQSVRNRRLSLFEAEEDLKKACGRLSPGAEAGFTVSRSA